MKKYTAALAALILLGVSGQVYTDYSIVLGPAMTTVVLRGDYIAAADAAYTEWVRERPPSILISSRKVSISAEPGTHLLYVRFSPLNPPKNLIDDCDSRLYAYDTQEKRIVWKDRCGANRNALPH